MIDSFEHTSNYFAPPAKSFWHWQDQGAVAVWKDDVTIAFRGEIDAVLSQLTNHGLPRLGSVLLLLAAFRDSWEQPPNRRLMLHKQLEMNGGKRHAELLSEVLTGLGQLHERRKSLTELSMKAALVSLLFEDAPVRLTASESRVLLNRFRAGLAGDELEFHAASALDDLVLSLGCLRKALASFDFGRLELRLQTGLDALPEPAPVEPPPPVSGREFIASLQDDVQLGATARLAWQLLAAIQMPRLVSDPDELPIGGVTDISNRGSLDRLLISELAHDDLTLAVRVAMNEALYLRRESPPKILNCHRRLLLDCSLRTWGIPRVFVTAVGLALAAKAEKHVSVEAYQAAADTAEPIDLLSANGLQKHLAALDHRLHPGVAVNDLVAKTTAVNDESVAGDMVVVTTEDALSEPEFQQALRSANGRLYIATVNRNGNFRLLRGGAVGNSVVCEAKFDLDSIFQPPASSRKLLDETKGLVLPAFMRESVPPLRFTCPVDLARAWYVHPHHVISYARDGRLLLWDQADLGARQVASGLKPDGNLIWCSSQWENDQLHLVIGKKSRNGLQAITYHRGRQLAHVQPLHLNEDQPLEVVGIPGALLVFFSHGIEARSWRNGQLLAKTGIADPTRVGNFFLHKNSRRGSSWWYTFCYRSGKIVAHLAADESTPEVKQLFADRICWENLNGHRVIAVAAPAGSEQILALSDDGDICDVTNAKGQSSNLRDFVEPPYSVIGVSRDQRRVLVGGSKRRSPNLNVLLELTQCQSKSLPDGKNAVLLEEPLFQLARPRIVHSRFRAIGFDRERRLVLVSRRGQHWPICLDKQNNILRFPAHPLTTNTTASLQNSLPFRSAASSSDGFTLEYAQWNDGSRAWLDGRGLLHLRSSSDSVPECSLVLTDGPISGWLATGHVFGPQYWCLGNQLTVNAHRVWGSVLSPFVARLS